MSSALKDYMNACQIRIEQALEQRLASASILPQRLHQAMRYSTLDGGKRMCPLLTYATGKALNIPETALDGPACAMEFIHVYSLIHDDYRQWIMMTCGGANRLATLLLTTPPPFWRAMPCKPWHLKPWRTTRASPPRLKIVCK